MLVLASAPDAPADGYRNVAIFGTGLIGGAIARSLCSRGSLAPATLPFSWKPGDAREAQLEAISRALVEHARAAGGPRSIDVVWSAGTAGFAADWAALDGELQSLRAVLRMCERIGRDDDRLLVRFHLVSSAGGLFEGQRDVGRDSVPAPRRPYGEAKLAQEAELAGHGTLASHVYRLSSVYGYCRGGRVGLILALIRDAYQRRATTIFGAPGTLRDFVHADDVGRFIADRIAAQATSPGTYLLAHGRPTSLRTVVARAELALGRQVYLEYTARPHNALHNTYRPSAVRHFSGLMSLREGIGRVARAWHAAEFAPGLAS